MKYFCLFILVTLDVLFLSCKTTKFVEDSLSNQYEEQVILKMGTPFSSNIYFVNSNYDFHSEIEPDYSKYLSEEAIKMELTLKRYIGNKIKKIFMLGDMMTDWE